MRRIILLIGLASVCIVYLSHYSCAQTINGLVSSPTIGAQETVSYTLEISGTNASDIVNPSPPAAEGLTLVSRNASRGTNMSIVNGRVSRSVSYTWQYRPEKEGSARILEASVTIGDSTFHTSPVTVTVVPQAQRPSPQRRSLFGGFSLFDNSPDAPPEVTEQDIFIRATQSDSEVYLNEQIAIDYKLYFRPGTMPRNSRQADSWDAEGFWREELDLATALTPNLVVENGIRYQVISIRRIAVFPTRAGELTIDPLKISTEVQSPDADPFSSPLFSQRYSTVERASPVINIRSIPLPPGAPDGFTGAVGQYTLRAALSRNTLEVGEALQLTLTIEGTGNIALIEAPQPEIPGIFEIYDPEVSISKTGTNTLISGNKTFTWLLIPRTNGTFQIPPVKFVYFDPAQEQYVVRSGNLNPITVTGTAAAALATTVTASGFPFDDIAVIKRDPQWVTATQTPLHRSTWFYLLLQIPVLVVSVTAVLRRRTTRLATDTAWARNQRAHPLARKHLKTARKRLSEGDPDAFYAALEQSVLGFVGNRLNVHERGLTRAQLADQLDRAGIRTERQRELIKFLDTCDAARFAPIAPATSQMEEHFAQGSRILSTIARELESVIS
ncbi:MAG: protein BatD [Rhodothermaceae bacterium]|nr:protein BatD [Rhodothermaceae bacterium]MYF64348.1 protein BatD [Rhodothermaceae bacterium]MYI83858.1 protein BatD [Rhodothermaceae bacterium]